MVRRLKEIGEGWSRALGAPHGDRYRQDRGDGVPHFLDGAGEGGLALQRPLRER